MKTRRNLKTSFNSFHFEGKETNTPEVNDWVKVTEQVSSRDRLQPWFLRPWEYFRVRLQPLLRAAKYFLRIL